MLTCELFWNSSTVVPAETPKTSRTRFPVTLVTLSPLVPESELGSSRTRVGAVAWVTIVTFRGARQADGVGRVDLPRRVDVGAGQERTGIGDRTGPVIVPTSVVLAGALAGARNSSTVLFAPAVATVKTRLVVKLVTLLPGVPDSDAGERTGAAGASGAKVTVRLLLSALLLPARSVRNTW